MAEFGPHDVTRFLNESNISERVKIENYLLVHAGVRSVSLTTIPGELPDGFDIGRAVDAAFSQRYYAGADPHRSALGNLVGRVSDAVRRATMHPVLFKGAMIRELMDEVLARSACYRAHLEWAPRLELQVYKTEVRPSVREIYLYRDPAVGARLDELMALRARYRKESRRELRPGTPQSLFVYPEERYSDYLEAAGRLLGYPECCSRRYIADRTSPDVHLEWRAAKQVKDLRQAGTEPDPHAYFIKDFFPCDPRCPEAAARGHRAEEVLTALDPRLGTMYRQGLERNLEKVAGFTEVIRAHEEKLREQLEELQRKTGE